MLALGRQSIAFDSRIIHLNPQAEVHIVQPSQQFVCWQESASGPSFPRAIARCRERHFLKAPESAPRIHHGHRWRSVQIMTCICSHPVSIWLDEIDRFARP
jgi:hypothetical protein